MDVFESFNNAGFLRLDETSAYKLPDLSHDEKETIFQDACTALSGVDCISEIGSTMSEIGTSVFAECRSLGIEPLAYGCLMKTLSKFSAIMRGFLRDGAISPGSAAENQSACLVAFNEFVGQNIPAMLAAQTSRRFTMQTLNRLNERDNGTNGKSNTSNKRGQTSARQNVDSKKQKLSNSRRIKKWIQRMKSKDVILNSDDGKHPLVLPINMNGDPGKGCRTCVQRLAALDLDDCNANHADYRIKISREIFKKFLSTDEKMVKWARDHPRKNI